jgi:hypothetical protein
MYRFISSLLMDCRWRWGSEEANKNRVGDSSEMLGITKVFGAKGDRYLSRMRKRQLAAVVEDAALECQV